jgi:transcriptional regulator with XRE-family HTH domain
MYSVEIYGRIRRAVLVEGKSERAVAREFGVARETVVLIENKVTAPEQDRQAQRYHLRGIKYREQGNFDGVERGRRSGSDPRVLCDPVNLP